MWALVLLNLLEPKNFCDSALVWMLIMAFFLCCFVHEAFDQPKSLQHSIISQPGRRFVSPRPRPSPSTNVRARLLRSPS